MSNIVFIGTVAASFLGFRKDLILDLKKNGHNIFAFVSDYKDENELKSIQALGAIPIIYHLNRGGLNPLADIKQTYDLANKIKRIDPDIVFSFFAKPVIFGTIAAKMAKVPRVIGMLEGLGYPFTDQPEGLANKTKLIKAIQVFLYKLSLPRLDKILFLNPDDPKDLMDRYNINVKEKIVLGPIGLNLENYPYSAIQGRDFSQGINFLFIGRLLKEKGIHDFVAAAKIVKQKYPHATFTVLGAIDRFNMGALKQNELEELIANGTVDYQGYVGNVKDWIIKSDVFVLPSYREGVPRSTQEAMAIGRAVITTDVPGCRETVQDGVNGFIVEKWNPQALAEKMIYFIENPKYLSIMGLNSYQIAKNRFDVNKVNQLLMKILLD